MLLRGLAKFAAVVVVAGLVGAGLGLVLAELSGNDGGETAGQAARVLTPPPATTETVGPEVADVVGPRVEVLSALLGRTSRSTGRALVAAKVRITNRTASRVTIEAPALLSGEDEVPANESAASNQLLRPLAPAASATGTVRFTLSAEATRRVTANRTARLRIADQTVVLNLTEG